MPTYVKRKNGSTVTLLNPAEKAKKYALEIKSGARITNDGVEKKKKDGSALSLRDTQKSYRAGYLDARRDSAKVYKHNKKKK